MYIYIYIYSGGLIPYHKSTRERFIYIYIYIYIDICFIDFRARNYFDV